MSTRRTGFESSDRPCPQCPWRLANQLYTPEGRALVSSYLRRRQRKMEP